MSQKEQIKKILLSQGEITRNVAIRELYITRLSDIVFKLKAEGWDIKGEDRPYEHGLDYVYYLVKSPMTKVTYTVPELNKEITLFK